MNEKPIKPKLAFIGIGLMGSRMVKRLLNAGYEVAIYNRSAEKCAPLAHLGAQISTSIAEAVGQAEIVLTCLAGVDAIEQVYFAEGGIASAAPADCLTIDLSSVAPDIAVSNHQRLAESGHPHLDSPVTGGVTGAEAGTLSILVGGSKENLNRAAPVLEVLGNPFHLGAAGAGQVCKLVNQAIVHIFIGGVAEGMMLAASVGVDAAKVREALMGGYCQSRILDIHGEKMANRDFTPGGPLEFAVKDVAASVALAESSNLELPLASSVLQGYREMLADGLGRLDHSALLLNYEKHNAVIQVSPHKEDVLP